MSAVFEPNLAFMDQEFNQHDFFKKLKDDAEKLFNGYDLCLMSELPKSKKPEPGKLYLEKKDGNIKYIVWSTAQGKSIEGTIDIQIQGDLTKEFLNKKKEEILEITSNRGHTPKTFTGRDKQKLENYIEALALICKGLEEIRISYEADKTFTKSKFREKITKLTSEFEKSRSAFLESWKSASEQGVTVDLDTARSIAQGPIETLPPLLKGLYRLDRGTAFSKQKIPSIPIVKDAADQAFAQLYLEYLQKFSKQYDKMYKPSDALDSIVVKGILAVTGGIKKILNESWIPKLKENLAAYKPKPAAAISRRKTPPPARPTAEKIAPKQEQEIPIAAAAASAPPQPESAAATSVAPPASSPAAMPTPPAQPAVAAGNVAASAAASPEKEFPKEEVPKAEPSPPVVSAPPVQSEPQALQVDRMSVAAQQSPLADASPAPVAPLAPQPSSAIASPAPSKAPQSAEVQRIVPKTKVNIISMLFETQRLLPSKVKIDSAPTKAPPVARPSSITPTSQSSVVDDVINFFRPSKAKPTAVKKNPAAIKAESQSEMKSELEVKNLTEKNAAIEILRAKYDTFNEKILIFIESTQSKKETITAVKDAYEEIIVAIGNASSHDIQIEKLSKNVNLIYLGLGLPEKTNALLLSVYSDLNDAIRNGEVEKAKLLSKEYIELENIYKAFGMPNKIDLSEAIFSINRSLPRAQDAALDIPHLVQIVNNFEALEAVHKEFNLPLNELEPTKLHILSIITESLNTFRSVISNAIRDGEIEEALSFSKKYSETNNIYKKIFGMSHNIDLSNTVSNIKGILETSLSTPKGILLLAEIPNRIKALEAACNALNLPFPNELTSATSETSNRIQEYLDKIRNSISDAYTDYSKNARALNLSQHQLKIKEAIKKIEILEKQVTIEPQHKKIIQQIMQDIDTYSKEIERYTNSLFKNKDVDRLYSTTKSPSTQKMPTFLQKSALENEIKFMQELIHALAIKEKMDPIEKSEILRGAIDYFKSHLKNTSTSIGVGRFHKMLDDLDKSLDKDFGNPEARKTNLFRNSFKDFISKSNDKALKENPYFKKINPTVQPITAAFDKDRSEGRSPAVSSEPLKTKSSPSSTKPKKP